MQDSIHEKNTSNPWKKPSFYVIEEIKAIYKKDKSNVNNV